MNKGITLITVLIILLSGCDIQNLRKLFDFKEPRRGEKPCIVGVWPAVKSGNKKYKMTEGRANQFIIDVQAATGYNSNYKRIKVRGKTPKTCKQLLWHNGSNVPGSYRSCMTAWGRKTIKNYNYCSRKNSFVVGSAITSSNGRAKILIVNLNRPNRYANKRSRYASGKDLKRLARNVGRAIRKEIGTLQK